MTIAPPPPQRIRPSLYQPHDKGRIPGDLHLVGYRDGERSGATYDRITGVLLHTDADAMCLGDDLTMTLDGDAIVMHLTINRDIVEGITVHDAPSSPAFRRLLFHLLGAGPYLLFCTSLADPGRLYHAGTVTEADVPADIIDGLGPLVRLADAEGLGEALT